MNLIALLTESTTNQASATTSIIYLVGWVVVLIGLFYFMIFRPQKKQQKQMETLISSLETGDSVLTTSGFYGVIIDVMEDVIIVEFGNNKNCRIPMKKTAVVEVEKAKKN